MCPISVGFAAQTTVERTVITWLDASILNDFDQDAIASLIAVLWLVLGIPGMIYGIAKKMPAEGIGVSLVLGPFAVLLLRSMHRVDKHKADSERRLPINMDDLIATSERNNLRFPDSDGGIRFWGLIPLGLIYLALLVALVAIAFDIATLGKVAEWTMICAILIWAVWGIGYISFAIVAIVGGFIFGNDFREFGAWLEWLITCALVAALLMYVVEHVDFTDDGVVEHELMIRH